MRCPVCAKKMTLEDLGGVQVDACLDGCKGMWFDWLELGKLDEKNEGFGQALQEAIKFPRTNNDKRQKINCPKCHVPMHIHHYTSVKEINIDECYHCGGFFLDSGELQVIRDRSMNEKERSQYAKKLITTEVPEFGKTEADWQRRKTRLEAIERFTKYLKVRYFTSVS